MTETDANLEQILAAITDGIVVVDQRGIVLYANQSSERIFERGKLPGRDLAIPLSPASAHQDINLIRRGGIGWAELRSSPITWAGQAAYVIGVRDITERKQSELGQRLATAVFDSTREGLLVTDVNKCIVRINPSFTDITGYSEADVLGKEPSMIGSGRHMPEFYEAMWGSIASVGYWEGEIWNRRKSGEIYPALASITVIKNDTGVVSNYVAVFADITSLKKSQSDLEFLAHYDPLTRLPNRLLLISNLQHAILRAQRDGKCLALLMIDLDRFKDINDSFGHLAGDELLQQVSGRLISKRREMDTICRLGGDEFTVLIEDVGQSENAARIANEIIEALSEPYRLANAVEVRIGASVGISIFPGHGETAELMLQQADSALYKAKTESLTLAARNRLDLEVRLRHAISHGELRVFYQPQVEIASGRIVGAEALVRWQSPSEGLISPARFIHIAEECGLIGEIDNWVLRETCAQGQRWIASGFKPITLAVNMSAYQLLDGDIVLSVAQVLSDTEFPAMYLELELTESALMKRETEAILILNQLRALGVQLAIDDFGTGYSSLAYLKLFPLDVLKIDKRFIDDIPLHRDDMEIVTAIIAMGHSLRLKVLAEGVENKHQLAYLKTQGCDLFQGYLTSQAVPAGEFEQFLKKL